MFGNLQCSDFRYICKQQMGEKGSHGRQLFQILIILEKFQFFNQIKVTNWFQNYQFNVVQHLSTKLTN